LPANIPANLISGANPHIKGFDLTKRGYMLIDINANRIKSDWWFVDTVTNPVTNVNFGFSWYANVNENRLRSDTQPVSIPPVTQPYAPALPNNPTTIDPEQQVFSLFGNFPNPCVDLTSIQFYLFKSGQLAIQLLDMQGKIVFEKQTNVLSPGLHQIEFSLGHLPSGLYFLKANSGGAVRSLKIQKQ
ncbi:MAG: T9SS type A sorting domain-containing protein, partial [Bacteroidia bacterium]|nr:T9SS type A sorting domain-containing protein [Bacteroidia bacterium]